MNLEFSKYIYIYLNEVETKKTKNSAVEECGTVKPLAVENHPQNSAHTTLIGPHNSSLMTNIYE